MHKQYISAQQLLEDSLELALRVIESGFRPDLVVGVWRGGAAVGVTVHEVLEFAGFGCDHMAIRTTSYSGIAQRGRVRVTGLDYLARTLDASRRVLLVDDVFDTGFSLYQVVRDLHELFQGRPPQLKLAVPWFKPSRNRTPIEPDYFVHTTADWLVFPHELAGLSEAEILRKPGLEKLQDRLLALGSGSRAGSAVKG